MATSALKPWRLLTRAPSRDCLPKHCGALFYPISVGAVQPCLCASTEGIKSLELLIGQRSASTPIACKKIILGRLLPLASKYSSMNPTVLTQGPYRFFFFSREEARPHIHVISSVGEAKFWLEPVVSLANSTSLSERSKKDSKDCGERACEI